MDDREYEQFNADCERIMKDDARKASFYEIAASAKVPVLQDEADRILSRWKKYGKTLFKTATQADLFVKEAMDQLIASQPRKD
jgi:hypothetical protein